MPIKLAGTSQTFHPHPDQPPALGKPADTTPPARPTLDGAYWGAFSYAKADPVWIELQGIEALAGTRLEVLNYSANPRASWKTDRIQLPGSPEKATGPSGKYGLKLTVPAAEALGMKAWDVLAIRQVDAAGNASEPVLAKINSKVESGMTLARPSSMGAIDDLDPTTPAQIVALGQRPGNSLVTFAAASDGRNLLVSADDICVTRGEGTAKIGANEAIEPFAKLKITNVVTQNALPEIVIGASRSFEAKILATPDQPLLMEMSDGAHRMYALIPGGSDRPTLIADLFDPAWSKMAFEAAKLEANVVGDRVKLSGPTAIGTPGTTVTFTNVRTQEKVTAGVMADGSVSASLGGAVGDAIHLEVWNALRGAKLDAGVIQA